MLRPLVLGTALALAGSVPSASAQSDAGADSRAELARRIPDAMITFTAPRDDEFVARLITRHRLDVISLTLKVGEFSTTYRPDRSLPPATVLADARRMVMEVNAQAQRQTGDAQPVVNPRGPVVTALEVRGDGAVIVKALRGTRGVKVVDLGPVKRARLQRR